MRLLRALPAIVPAALAWMLAVVTPLVAGAWWPIAAASEVIAERSTTFDRDWISYAPLDGEWVLQPWLPALAFLGTWELGGATLLSILAGVLWAATAMLCYLAARAAGGQTRVVPLAAMAATLLAFPALWPFTLQTQSVAVLLVFVLSLLLWTGRWGWAPLVIVLWANSHGAVPVGVLLCAIAAVGLLGPAIPEWLADWKRRAAWLGTCALGVLVSPLGLDLFDYIRDVGSIPDITALTPVWSSRDVLSVGTLAIVGTVAAIVWHKLVGSHRDRSLRTLGTCLVVAGAGAGALVSARHSVWFAAVATPHLALVLHDLWRRRGGAATIESRFVGFTVAGTLAAMVLLAFPGGRIQGELSRLGIPSDDVIAPIRPGARVLAAIEWADYVHVATGAQVYVDARLERYDDATLTRYLRFREGERAVSFSGRPSPSLPQELVLLRLAVDSDLQDTLEARECVKTLAADNQGALLEWSPSEDCGPAPL